MKLNDLVKYVPPSGLEFHPMSGRLATIIRIDKEHYGARQAFKKIPAPRGHAVIDARKPSFLAPTKRGIYDRVLVMWADNNDIEYTTSHNLKTVNEA